jgi:cbb3-type cytochrome oxidase cytochrome c subunit/peptidoglycan hydrolase CwlO-like protein
MPATEETFRRQPTLHLVFAISSIVMLLATVWMVMADHLRPWKQVQREFQLIERAKLNKSEEEKQNELNTKYKAQLDEIQAKIEAANKSADENRSKIRSVDAEISKLDGSAEDLDIKKRFKKTELDSTRSLYDGMIDRGEEREARVYLGNDVAQTERALKEFSVSLEVAQAKLKAKKDEREELLGNVDKLDKETKRLTREADRVKGLIESKDALYGGPLHWYSAPMAFIRSLPGIDLAPPTKIQQISLPDLTINYNFKEVPRYDRCQTCHQGIDRTGYEKDAEGKPMPTVFKSHPFLESGATTIDPRGNVVKAGLYLDGNGPHPLNSFGCTICHGGQGSGTDFTFASHTPDSIKQGEEWTEEHGWQNWHFWDFPMMPDRFIESGCLKCHTQVTDIPQAAKLQAGFQRITKFGCTGCHAIGGEGSTGPDLSDERQVGPNLSHIAAKDAKEWVVKWITNPHAFRPDSRMPRFYGLSNNGDAEDWPKNYAEIYSIAHYLYSKSTPPADFAEPPAQTDPAKGKELFLQKGCMACHQHRPYAETEIQVLDKKSANPAYKLDAAATFDPKNFPASVQENALADFGPNLSNIAAKFAGKKEGQKWLTNWILSPEGYHPKSLMPNLQLAQQEAADIASWLLSVPGEWPVTVDVLALDSKEVKGAVDELVKLYISKSGSFKTADGKSVTKSLSEIEEFVTKDLKRDDKLFYLGEKTISRLGCFGCHSIPGFENAKPIGTALNDWGIKNPARLDFGHIAEYLTDPEHPPDEKGTRDGTDQFYQEKIHHETRMGFLFQKLHRPRSYDYKKKSETYKNWDDRLRMPQFAWANDPKAIEEVMTFILGLTGEKVAAKYLPGTHTTAARTAVAQGAKVLNRFNCAGCHVLEMPKFTIPEGTTVAEAFPAFKGNLSSSYRQRNNDYAELNPGLKYDPATKLDAGEIEKTLGITADDGSAITIEGMPIGLFENELSVQVWQPVTIRGYTFNVADIVTLDQTKIKKTPAVGGDFAFLYATSQAERTGQPLDSFWNRLPPPLLREGKKVQTPWLTAFLKNPHMIRPAAGLRMPRFHYGKDDKTPATETDSLANFFAARDRATFPYQSIPEQTPSYLAERNKDHPDYLGSGWTIMTNRASPCLQCHAIGQFKPTGGATVVNGPDLREVAARFRPEFLEAWIANPSRMLPFTAMPQNIAPHGDVQIQVPKGFEKKPIEMVRAVRDTLLNYVNAIELQLASSSPAPAPGAPQQGTPPKASSNNP